MTALVYADASAFTTPILGDEGAAQLAAVLGSLADEPLVSDFGWGEFIAAVGRRVRMQALRKKPAQALVASARSELAEDDLVLLESEDIRLATELLGDFDLALKLPDAIHIAIARRLGATLLSTDRQQVAAARLLGVTCLNPLEEAE